MKPNCLCCKQQVTPNKVSKILSLVPFEGSMRRSDLSFKATFFLSLTKYPFFYQWACDDCLDAGKALLGNPDKQFYTFSHPADIAPPHLAYFDKKGTCRTCSAPFVFTKEEQQHWYETLGFVVFSHRTICKNCSAKKQLNKTLSRLLKNGQPTDRATLLEISTIYKALEKEEKHKKYWTLANKISS